jgi:hypothetical protein
MVHDGF